MGGSVINSIPLQQAQRDVQKIFCITKVNEKGKSLMRCSRCEVYAEKDRGRSFQCYAAAFTKAKEHIAVYCPDVAKSTSEFDQNCRHTLLISMSEKHVSTMNKSGQLMCEFLSPPFDILSIFRCLLIF